MAPTYSELVESLIDGARFDDAEDVQTALDQGVDVNAQDEQGRTAVHMAAANGHVELLHALVKAGADVRLGNNEGNTPLHWACVNNQKDAARLLLEAGASASALNSHDMTPMDEALTRDLQELVDLINEFSAPVKDTDEVDIIDGGDDAQAIDMGAIDDDGVPGG